MKKVKAVRDYSELNELFSKGYRRYLALWLTSFISAWVPAYFRTYLFFGDIIRHHMEHLDWF